MGKTVPLTSADHPLIGSPLYGVPLMFGRADIDRLIRLDAEIREGKRLVAARDTTGATVDVHGYAVMSGTAVVPIIGTIMKRGTGDTWLDNWIGVCSCERLLETLQMVRRDPTVERCLFEVDSPGGSTNGVFDVADVIFDMRNEMPVWAHANEWAFSAGYLLASSAERTFVPRTGGMGSIGVYGVRIDMTKLDKDVGIDWHILEYGERKADGHPHKAATSVELQELQAEIDRLGIMFRDAVARNRDHVGLNAKAIDRMQARAFFGEDCFALGLADGIATLQDVMQKFATMPRTQSRPGGRQMATPNKDAPAAEAQGQGNEGDGKVVTVDFHTKTVDTERGKAADAEALRCSTIADQCIGAGHAELIGQFQADRNMTPDKVAKHLADLKVAADKAAAEGINNNHRGGSPGAQSRDTGMGDFDGDAIIKAQRESAQSHRFGGQDNTGRV